MYEPDHYSSRRELKAGAFTGGISLGGGIALLIINGLGKVPFLGVAAGIGMLVLAYRILTRTNGRRSGDTLMGSILAAVGILTTAAGLPIPLLGGLSSFLLWGSGIGLIGYGIWNLIKGRRGDRS